VPTPGKVLGHLSSALADLPHGFDGARVYLVGGIYPCTVRLEAVADEGLNNPSAIWLLAEFWVQRKSTFCSLAPPLVASPILIFLCRLPGPFL
jgi:hypothetical protein